MGKDLAAMPQWGRDLTIAELRNFRKRKTGEVGFNGAAILRSRNLTEIRRGRRWVIELQWGRDLTIAEFRAPHKQRQRVLLLQWGRDLTIAELHFPRIAMLIAARLQWGRDLTIAELRGVSLLTAVPWRFNGAAILRSRN